MESMMRLMTERQSARMLFDPGRRVPKEDLKTILEAGRWAPTPHNMQNYEVVIVDDPELLEEIADMKRPVSDIFMEENYRNLSFSEEEYRRKRVGLLASALPPFMRGPKAPRDEATGKPQMTSLERPLRGSPVLVIMTYDPRRRAPASEGDFLGIMGLGCVMENMWLMAASLGISFHIISALAEEPLESEVKRLLSIPEKLKVAITFRLGYALPVQQQYLRVRRDVSEFAHYNRYESKGVD
ncbi:MAG: nitroreductase family protein [Bacteroidetes bacterium]|nr:nitroreductase family protein [Bacteroidota bacterium]